MEELNKEIFEFDSKLANRKSYNLQIVELTTYNDFFMLELNFKNQKFKKKLIIDHVGRIYEIEKLPDKRYKHKSKFSVFLGILHLFNSGYMLFVEEVYYIASMEGHEIFEIAS